MAVGRALIDDIERRATIAAAGGVPAGGCLAAGGPASDGAGAASTQAAAATVGRALLMATQAPHAAVFLRAPSGVVTCPWSHNLPDAYVRDLITPDGVNPWIHLMKHPELTCVDMPKNGRTHNPTPWFLHDVQELPHRNAVRQRLERAGLRSICTWPLSRGGRVVGAVVYYYDVPHVCSAPEEETMRAFALQAADAVHGGAANRARGQSAGERVISVAGPGDEQARLSETQTRLREERDRLAALQRDLAAEQARLAAERASLEAEYRRLADTRAAFAAESEWLAEVQRRLDGDTVQKAGRQA